MLGYSHWNTWFSNQFSQLELTYITFGDNQVENWVSFTRVPKPSSQVNN
jgi:hypothetical protein